MKPVREKVGALPSPGLASLLTQLYRFGGFHCSSREVSRS